MVFEYSRFLCLLGIDNPVMNLKVVGFKSVPRVSSQEIVGMLSIGSSQVASRMRKRVTNIHDADFEERPSPRGEPDWRCLDLSGEHLGVRIEELPPGSNSSFHHYHTSEEEHVLVLDGSATLHLGDSTVEIGKGDHVMFPAGEEVAHHIENTSSGLFTYLVFGERKQDDVVIYPHSSIALVKSSQGNRWYRYQEYVPDD